MAGWHLRRGACSRCGLTSSARQRRLRLDDAGTAIVTSGIACAFDSYEVLRGDAWVLVKGGIPGKAERIRVVDASLDEAAA